MVQNLHTEKLSSLVPYTVSSSYFQHSWSLWCSSFSNHGPKDTFTVLKVFSVLEIYNTMVGHSMVVKMQVSCCLLYCNNVATLIFYLLGKKPLFCKNPTGSYPLLWKYCSSHHLSPKYREYFHRIWGITRDNLVGKIMAPEILTP